jgi:hypothetical protein
VLPAPSSIALLPGPQGRSQVGRAGVAGVGVARHRARRHRRQAGRHAGPHGVGRGRVDVHHGIRDLGQRLALEGLAPGQQLVEHDTERIDVGAAVDRAAFELFGRQVVGRPGDQAFEPGLHRAARALGDARDAEVQHRGFVACA